MDFLIDPTTGFYVLLVAAVAVAGALWVRSRKRGDAVGVAVAAAVLLAVFVIDTLYESGREQAVRKVVAMRDALNAHDAGRIVEHVSESFKAGGSDRAMLKSLAERGFREDPTLSLTVWGFDRSGVVYGTGADGRPTVMVPFMAKPSAELIREGTHFVCKSTFVQDADGQWRLQTFQLFNPIVNTNEPVSVPGL